METHVQVVIRALSERFRVLLLGGAALIFYGRERPTFDADIWLEPMEDAQIWARELTAALRAYEESYFWDLAARRKTGGEEIADLAETFGVVRIGGLSENLDVFRRPNNFAEVEFDVVWNASKPFVGERLRVLHEVDLLASKMETERAKDFEDVAFLEARIRQDIGSRLALCAPDEAAALFARYADHVTCAAALTNPHAEVRALALETLREIAAEGNPFAREILAGRRDPAQG